MLSEVALRVMPACRVGLTDERRRCLLVKHDYLCDGLTVMRWPFAGIPLLLCTRAPKDFLIATCARPLVPLAMAGTAAGPNPVHFTTKPILPPLSASEFRLYNRMADGMEYYVRHSTMENFCHSNVLAYALSPHLESAVLRC